MRRWIAIAIVAPWAAWAIARTAGLDRFHPLIAFAAFTPYAALTSPVPLAVALALRRWAAAAVAVVAIALFAVAILPRATGSPGRDLDVEPVTVMTSNLYGGGGDPRRIAELVRRHDVDLLFVQELTPQALARLDRAGVDAMLPYQATEARQPGLGNGILSRYPLRRVRAWSAPNEPGADVDLPGGERLRVRVVHQLPPTSRARARNWRTYLRLLPSALRGPAVLAGDFNATLDHRDLRRVLDRGWDDAADATGEGLKPTWPVGRPILGLTIDHVLAGAGVEVSDVRLEEVRGSDHRAVIAELGVRR